MARLFDKLREQNTITEDIPVIHIDNITKYLYLLSENGHEKHAKIELVDGRLANPLILSKKDYPCVIPPFEKCFFESSFLHECSFKDYKWGAFLETYKNTTRVRIYIGLLQLAMENVYKFNETGEIIGNTPISWRERNHPLIERDFFMMAQITTEILIAISFMHCKKQTKLIEHIPPEKVQRKRIKNNKLPLTKYYTLDIEPLKEILRTEGRVHEVGLPKALHICRGHFKDYSQGKGLFGKYKGLYWWDNHIRGSEDAGIIVKDYAVKLPDVEEFN